MNRRPEQDRRMSSQSDPETLPPLTDAQREHMAHLAALPDGSGLRLASMRTCWTGSSRRGGYQGPPERHSSAGDGGLAKAGASGLATRQGSKDALHDLDFQNRSRRPRDRALGRPGGRWREGCCNARPATSASKSTRQAARRQGLYAEFFKLSCAGLAQSAATTSNHLTRT
jgi:hypothetical protein